MKKQNNYTPNAGCYQSNSSKMFEKSQMWKRNRFLFLILITILGNSAVSAQTIQNGALTYGASFPATNGGINPTYPPFWLPAVTGSVDMLNSAGFTTLCGSGTCVDLQLTASPATASGGSCVGAIGFSSTSGEGFKQTINGLTVGRTYTISFYQNRLSTCSNCSPTYTVNGRWGVKFDLAGTPVYAPTMIHPNNNNLGWQQVSVNLTATAESHELIFFASVPDNNGVPIIAIDDVSIMIAPENCNNGIDDDGDGLVDCDDPDCGVPSFTGIYSIDLVGGNTVLDVRASIMLKERAIAQGVSQVYTPAMNYYFGIRVVNMDGTELRKKIFSHSDYGYVWGLKQLSDESIIMWGQTGGSTSFSYIMKFDVNLNVLWTRNLNVSYGLKVVIDEASGVIYGTGSTNGNGLFTSLSISNGNINFLRVLDCSNSLYSGTSIFQDVDGSIYIGGGSCSGAGNQNISKFDNLGNLIFTKDMNLVRSPLKFIKLANGNLICINNSVGGDPYFEVLEITPIGGVVSYKRVNVTGGIGTRDFITYKGGYLVSGVTTYLVSGLTKYAPITLHFDTDWNLINSNQYLGTSGPISSFSSLELNPVPNDGYLLSSRGEANTLPSYLIAIDDNLDAGCETNSGPATSLPDVSIWNVNPMDATITFGNTYTSNTTNFPVSTTLNFVQTAICSSGAVEFCTNGLDDDGDGLVDLNDPDCICYPVEICTNGIDDDGDGLVDCMDSDCPVCVENCTNGIDDDGDGLVDCDDPDCGAHLNFTAGYHKYKPNPTSGGMEFYSTGLAMTASGNFVLNGGVSGDPAIQRYGVLEVSPNGSIVNAQQWNHNLGMPATSENADIVILPDGTRVEAFVHLVSGVGYHTKVIKRDALGNIQWAVNFDVGQTLTCRMKLLPDGNLLLHTREFLIKINQGTGAILWSKAVGNVKAFCLVSDGIVTASILSGPNRIGLTKLGWDGSVISTHAVNLLLNVSNWVFLASDRQDNIYLTQADGTASSNVVKINSTLTSVLWTKFLGITPSPIRLRAIGIYESNDGASMLVATDVNIGGGLMKIDKNTGDVIWWKRYDNNEFISGNSLMSLGNGYAFVMYDGSLGTHYGQLVIVNEDGEIGGCNITNITPALSNGGYSITSGVVNVADFTINATNINPVFTNFPVTHTPCLGTETFGFNELCSESCDKIPNVAFIQSVDEVDPVTNNNRGNADLKLGSCTCDLNPIAYEVQCNNNGTPNNPADDTYNITNFIVTAAAGGGVGGYNLSGGITASGNAYGTAYSYGPFPISGGPLSVTVTDVNTTSCTRTDEVIPPLPCSSCTVMGAANGDAVCAGESIQLTASGGDTYSWTGPDGFSSADQNPVINGATAAMAGNYTVVITNTGGGGCTDTEMVSVTVNALPVVSAGADQLICEESITTLVATGCSGTLLWSTGETTASISVNPVSDAVYSVSCTDAGCVGTDEVVVRLGSISLTATPSACVPATSTHGVSGSLIFNTPPATGTLIVSASGQQQVFNAPFVSPLTYNLSGIMSTGGTQVVSAIFSDSPMCEAAITYTSPAACSECVITNLSVTPGLCNPLTNLYTLSGSLTFTNAPSTGTLTITGNGGGQTVIDAPFTSPVNFSFPGLISDAAAHQLLALFSDNPGCIGQADYISPDVCTNQNDPCTIGVTAQPGTCDIATNQYTITGSLTFTNAPTGGRLVVFIAGGGQQDFYPPFLSPLTYSIPGLNSDGSQHTVTAQFTDDIACSASMDYTAPALCAVDCNIRLSMEVGVCDPNTNTYTVTGEVYINNPPSGGNIIISYPGGQQMVANTGVSPVSFQIPGLPASGGVGEIGVTMSNDLPCYTRSIYEIPGSCGVVGLCSVAVTANPGLCAASNNDYTLSGTVTFANAPAGGLVLQVDGITYTVPGPVSSPYSYALPGMPSDGSDHQLLVYFANNANCSNRVTYTAPAVCAPNTCTMSMNLVTGTCQSATNTFSVSGSVTVSNAPVSGQLRIWIEGTGFETVINAPFGANIPFSFNNMVSSGLPYDIKASFSADLSCQVRKSFIAPDACFSGAGCEVQILAAAECTSASTFTVTGMVLIQNAPLSGTMTISAGSLQQTLSAPFDPMVFIGFSGFPLGTDVPVGITFSADPGCSVTTTVDAPQDCNCEVSLGTVSGLCVAGTETHNARGTVTFVNPPLTGILTISVPGGQSEVFTAPFNSPLYYEVTGLPDGGGSRTVTAAFSADAGCTATQSYTAPVRCANDCNIRLSMEVGVCDPNTNTYAVTGEVYINNPPSGGNIIISYPGGQQTVANTGVSPVSFQIPGLPASGGIGEIGVTMSNDLPCYTHSIYEIPESCGVASLCSISATASASPCDPEHNDYTLTGTLTFSNAPAGNIILEIDGITHTITGPVSSPLMYEIPGMPSDGSDHQLLVYFASNTNCSNRVTYTAPAVCAPNTCTMSMNLVTGTCQSATNTFSVSGSLTVSNAPASGQLRIWIEGTGIETVINAPFGANIPFLFNNMVSSRLPYDIKASFSADLSCQVRKSFIAPDACFSGGGCEVQVLAAAECTSGATFTVTGMVLIQNAPLTGTMTISAGPLQQTLSAPFDPMVFIGFSGFPLGTDVPVEITFSADAGCSVTTTVDAPQDCNCEVSLGTVSGLCVVGTVTHNARGTVTFVNPPLTGTLTISVPGGQSEVFTAPFNSPLYYEVTGLPDGGGSRTVTAAFSADAGCTATQSYTAPVRCANDCNIRLSMEVGVCDPNTNTYAVTGEVYINNPPSGGNIIISYPGGQQTVANTGLSPVSFQIPGLPATGGIGEIGVTMSNDLPCYTHSIYEIPESCGVASLCSISATASASPCDPEHNDYTLTGTLTFSNAPTGNIILEIDGITHTITGPVSSPLMYEIPGMPSDGSDHQLLVYFASNTNCSNRVTYTAPAVCAPNTCTMSMNLVTGTCQSATNTFSVSGSLTVSNAPASGQLRIWIEGTGIETVINAPFGANIPFSFNNMVSSGLPYDIKASFSAELSCQVRKSFIAPDACFIGGGCEVQVLAAAECTSGATFTVTGMVMIQNAPSSGTMTISAGPLKQTLSAPFDPMVFIGFSGFPLGTDVPVEITFSADAGCRVTTTVDAPQDCNCEVSLGTVSGLCVEGTETHNARGTVTFVNPPLTGTLTVSVPGGQSEVFTAPFNSPLYYEVTGLPDGGGSRTVTAAFSADAGCTATQSYTAPVDCPICDIQLPVVQSLSCYNNDTPSKITDNKIRVRLLVTNANPALTTYNLTVNGGTTISPAVGLYGVGTEFTMGPGTAGGGATFIITITDSSGLTCNTAEVTVPDPGNCNNTTECPTIKCGSVIIQVNGN
jgi:hypothetical protein